MHGFEQSVGHGHEIVGNGAGDALAVGGYGLCVRVSRLTFPSPFESCFSLQGCNLGSVGPAL